MELTLQNLKDNRLECNIENTLFVQVDMEYLGFWMTRNINRPINKNVDAKVDMMPSKHKFRLRAFVVLVHHYKGMWDIQSQLLQPITPLTSEKLTFKWIDMEKKYLDGIKRIMARDIVLE